MSLARPVTRRRRRARGLAAVVPACAVAALAAGCGSSRHGAGTHSGSATAPANTVPASASGTLGVSPSRPSARSQITFRFTAPVTSGVHGAHEIGYSLSVTGTAAPGCIGADEASAPAVAGGASASITLGPDQLKRPWCTGAYAARVIELERAHCTGSAPCPQYIRVVAIVARATFTVERG